MPVFAVEEEQIDMKGLKQAARLIGKHLRLRYMQSLEGLDNIDAEVYHAFSRYLKAIENMADKSLPTLCYYCKDVPAREQNTTRASYCSEQCLHAQAEAETSESRYQAGWEAAYNQKVTMGDE